MDRSPDLLFFFQSPENGQRQTIAGIFGVEEAGIETSMNGFPIRCREHIQPLDKVANQKGCPMVTINPCNISVPLREAFKKSVM